MTAKKIAFLGTPGYVLEPTRFENADLLKAVGANTGNLLFQLGSSLIVGGETHHVGFSGKAYDDPAVFRNLDYLVFPAANHLREDANWEYLTKFLAGARGQLVVVGLGAQAPLNANPARTAAAIRSNDSVMDFVSVLKSKAALITVRGEFTEAVCHALGLTSVVRAGCPSQFINPEKTLGRSIAAQISAMSEAQQAGNIAVTASAPADFDSAQRKDVEAQLFSWLATQGGLYVQQSCEPGLFDGVDGRLNASATQWINKLRNALSRKGNGDEFAVTLAKSFRVYFDARDWLSDMARMQLAIGTRVHGNIAALSAGRPGVLIVHDARVSELADEMRLPRIPLTSVAKHPDLKGLLGDVRFDGHAFDAARAGAAAVMLAAFQKIGLPASDHLRALALREAA